MSITYCHSSCLLSGGGPYNRLTVRLMPGCPADTLLFSRFITPFFGIWVKAEGKSHYLLCHENNIGTLVRSVM